MMSGYITLSLETCVCKPYQSRGGITSALRLGQQRPTLFTDCLVNNVSFVGKGNAFTTTRSPGKT